MISPLTQFTPVVLSRLGFVDVHNPRGTHEVQQLGPPLVVGEFKAIAPAFGGQVKIPLIDELMGRTLAEQSGFVRRAWERGLLNI